MKRIGAMIVAGMVLQTSLAATAQAGPGIDCRTAVLPAQLEMCRQGFLMAFDQQMLAAFFALRQSLSEMDQRALDASQRRWQADRDRCGAFVPCLRALYARRMEELNSWR
jgi:uncharacterized protein